MKKYFRIAGKRDDTVHITQSNVQCLSTTIFIVVAVLVWLLSCTGVATADVYADSAHGDTTYGVDRSGTPDTEAYNIGACVHCHDTFDDSICGVNSLMMFAPNNPTSQTDNFCFQCHKSTGSLQVGGIIYNNDYGATFGGGDSIFDSIYDAFNPSGTHASSHDLGILQNYVKNSSWGSWMTDNSNACLACHDHHLSQKNFPVEINAYGGVNTAIKRANDVDDYPGDLWGDEPQAVSGRDEMMSDWTSGYIYQAPFRGDSGYEPGPADSTVEDGSNLPSFVMMCAGTCHRRKNVPGVLEVNWITSTSTDWPGTPSMHGKASANGGGFGVLKVPYSEASRGNYVLSCTDCHEPHGSTNPTLLRTTVNGESGLSTGAEGSSSAGGYWLDFCEACHEIYNEEDPGSSNHPVIYPGARCGKYVGCHMSTGVGGSGGNHGYQF